MEGLVKSYPLKPGDFVGIASPGACLTDEGRIHLETAVCTLEGLGFRVKAMPDLDRRDSYFAGKDWERANELMALFHDSTIRAILCARGGYGSQRIIPFLDPRGIHKNAKVFMGSRDITVLLVYLLEQCGVVPFHGPKVATQQFLRHPRSRASTRSPDGTPRGR